jgi:hypothetical protein
MLYQHKDKCRQDKKKVGELTCTLDKWDHEKRQASFRIILVVKIKRPTSILFSSTKHYYKHMQGISKLYGISNHCLQIWTKFELKILTNKRTDSPTQDS